jgi:archaeal preflagellin peptidase FlaK
MSATVPVTIEAAALLLSVAALLAASFSDLKTREVSNKVWLVYGPSALALFVARMVFAWDLAPIVGVSAISTFVVAFLLFHFGVMGGADSKALMCLGLALPVPPAFLNSLWIPPIALYPFPIAILANSFLLSIVSGVVILFRNIGQGVSAKGLFRGFEKETVLRKLLVMFTSYKTSFSTLQSSNYLYPAEKVEVQDSKPVRHLHLVSSAEEDRDKLVSGLQDYNSQGLFSDGVWVTPGLPHLVFMTASLLTVVLVGDLVMWMFFRVVGYSQ